MQKGFTLIELMLSVALLAVVLGIAIPNFTIWIKNSRIDASTQTLASAFQLARNEAISRQSVITINNNGDWSNGLTIYTDADAAGNTLLSVPDGDTLIKSLNYSMDGITVSTTPNNNNLISFSSAGLLNEGGGETSITICDERGVAEATMITLNVVGRASTGNAAACP